MVIPIKNLSTGKGHSSQYKVHKYYARRPWNTFNELVQHYSKKNDIVLDVFCGGGTTIYESLSLNRKSIGIDLNPLATFITEMQLHTNNSMECKKSITKFFKKIEEKYSEFYNFKNKEIEYIVYTYVVKCNKCQSSIELEDKNKIRNGVYKCININCENNVIGIKRVDAIPNGIIPKRIKYLKDSKLYHLNIEEIKEIQTKYFTKYKNTKLKEPDKNIPLKWDRRYEDKLIEKGINKISDFFTDRNYILNTLIFNEILESKTKYKDILYYIFSASLRYTNNMTRISGTWQNGKPVSMDKHAYWLPNEFIENNIFLAIKNRLDAFIKASDYSNKKINRELIKAKNFDDLKDNGDYMILTQSATSMPFENNSIDLILTDPPYGSNVQYFELSEFWNIWLEIFTNKIYDEKNLEAVMNRKKFKDHKTVKHYEKILTNIFKESYRVLKKNSYLVFTFNNKNFQVWLALLKSVANAGFYLPKDGIIFQDYIQSYKNTSHLKYKGNIHGDIILSFIKRDITNNKLSKNQVDLNIELENIISKLVENVFKVKSKVSTNDLHKHIYINITQKIFNNIKKNKYGEIDFSRYSENVIDNILRKKLELRNNYWVRK